MWPPGEAARRNLFFAKPLFAVRCLIAPFLFACRSDVRARDCSFAAYTTRPAQFGVRSGRREDAGQGEGGLGGRSAGSGRQCIAGKCGCARASARADARVLLASAAALDAHLGRQLRVQCVFDRPLRARLGS